MDNVAGPAGPTNTVALEPAAVTALHTTETLAEFVGALEAAYGDRPAIDVDGDVLTYRQLVQRSGQLACGLLHRGIGKGSRVALIFANGAQFAIALAAVTRIGAIAVPLSTLFKPPELARVLRHGDIQAILAQQAYQGQNFVANLQRAVPTLEVSNGTPLRAPEAPFLRWVVFFDDAAAPSWAHEQQWLGHAEAAGFGAELLTAAQSEVHPDDAALMVYTSGQSAEPKGVVHSHGGVLRKTHYLREVFGFAPTSRVPAGLPLFWVGGMVMSLLPVWDAGGTTCCRRAPSSNAPKLGAVGVNRPDFRARGATTDRLVGLGMTETFGPYSWGREMPDPERPLCPPLVEFEPGYDVKVVDADGAPVPDGGAGEIALRGPTVMTGLHKVDRSRTFDPDGFYRTGDRAEVNGELLYFLGRHDDMIKVSGANVAPTEVECQLLAIEGVVAAHVVAVDDPDRGHRVGAALVAGDGVQLDCAAIITTLRERLSTYKVPTVLAVVAAEEVPTLATGKIARRQLAALICQRGTAS